MGVRTDYRPFAADEVAELIPSAAIDIGFVVRQEKIIWQPPEGFSIAVDLPTLNKEFRPAPFKEGR
jgi:hypothetical protein